MARSWESRSSRQTRKRGETGRLCLFGRSEPAPVSGPNEPWHSMCRHMVSGFCNFPSGAGSRRLRSFKQAAFLLRRRLGAERCLGSRVSEGGRHRPPVLACSRTSLSSIRQPQAQDAFLIGGARQPLMKTVYQSQYGMGGRAIISQKITSTAANAGNPKANHHRKSW